jgi:diacylglycerol kinase family enzyme
LFLAVSERESVLVARKFLVFINPKAGVQQGEAIFKAHVEPMLNHAEINYHLEVTSE